MALSGVAWAVPLRASSASVERIRVSLLMESKPDSRAIVALYAPGAPWTALWDTPNWLPG